MSYEITYRRKLVKTLNPDFWLWIEERWSNNCRSLNSSTGREQRARDTIVELINFKDNRHLKILQEELARLTKEYPEDDVAKWSPRYWLSWESKCSTVKGTVDLYEPKSFKSEDSLIEKDNSLAFAMCLPSIYWTIDPGKVYNPSGRNVEYISDDIFRYFKKRKKLQ